MTTGNPVRWMLLSGTETVGQFSRKIVFADVNRDVSNNITQSGGTLDSNTKKVTATVSWTSHARTHEATLVIYLTNWKL